MLADLEATLKRFDAWFNFDVHDRPPVTFQPVWRPAGDALPVKNHKNRRERLFDVEFRLDFFEKALPFQDFPGDTLPTFKPGIGIGEAATLFGGKIEINDNSCWAVHCIDNIRDVIGRKPDWNNEIWSAIRRLADASASRANGRWLTSVGISGVPDIMVDLRGPENLCIDVMDDPEGVRLANDHIGSFMPAVYDDIWNRIAGRDKVVSILGEGPVGKGRIARMESDFLCMISPATAESLFYESLRKRIASFDRCYWHADGPGWLNHLDFLLRDKNLKGVQWVYGAGNGPASKWIDVYKRIQNAGKSIELMPESIQDALEVMRHLKPQGVWIKFWPRFPVEEAEKFVVEVAKRSNWAK